MFVKHFAWLHSRAGKSKVSRFEQLKNEDIPSPLLQLPQIDYAEYLLEYLFEIGISKPSSTGLVSLTWTDIASWSSMTGQTLDLWESKTIVELSRRFVNAFNSCEGEIVPAPYQPENVDQRVVGQRVGNLLRGIAKRKSTRNRR